MLYLSKNPSLLPLPDGWYLHFYDPLISPSPRRMFLEQTTMLYDHFSFVFSDGSAVTFETMAGRYCWHRFDVNGTTISVSVLFDPSQPLRAPSLVVLLRETYTKIINEQDAMMTYDHAHFSPLTYAVVGHCAVVTLDFVSDHKFRVIAPIHTATIDSDHIDVVANSIKRCLENNGFKVLFAQES